MTSRLLKNMICAVTLGTSVLSPLAHAGLFDDDEARKAILDIRSRLDSDKQRIEGLTRNVLDLNNQIQQLQRDLADQRGQNEDLKNQLANLQQSQKDFYTDLDGRLKKFEPQQMTVGGVTGTVQPGEKEVFDAALDKFRKGDYKGAQTDFRTFTAKYPGSPYQPEALFWLGNSQYANNDLKGSTATLQGIVTKYPDSPKAAEALMAIASNAAAAGQVAVSKKAYNDLLAKYPNSQSAADAKKRWPNPK
ncbi:tol-pal system protein YbgF [Pandoraea vervacti]|uniref:Cell division coordinator CpoB n=1 Tax=Pandoraea vervacti TaxID=656178 RepID=A0ABM5SWV9_9BURK|nr:tol-pal system protein YbgF [Pandoraea vervacti]